MTNRSVPMGLGWTKYLPFLVCGLVGLCVVSVAGHGGNIKHGDTCVPWYCSCFYRGVYYDEGDIWDSEDDPCRKYKCLKNGVYIPIKSGCAFKGTCHDRGTEWTEGCFRYKCLAGHGTSFYQLHEAACVWTDGNCYLVGQQVKRFCDVYECQIDDGCYVMKKVRSACKTRQVDNPCKPLFSFWQDECAVYQCLGEDKDVLRARILTHSHDVMMWPRGHYALPEPKEKCANFGEEFWVEGAHIQSGDGCNYESQIFDLLGDYNDTTYDHHFCVHHDVDDPDIIPVYQTYWEPGRYCILRYNGSCPRDFSEGFVEMTNSISNVTNITSGVLPDGNFTENVTRMEFCCRYDGEIHRPIVLPAKHPFVLFMAENETECQAVQGMHHRIEFWSFCDIEDGVHRRLNGSLPLIKTGDNNTLINFCYYAPIGCGCTDEDEAVVAMGDTVRKNCVTRECKQIQKYNVMVITEGGCYDEVNKVCRDENVTWTDKVGEMCKDRLCVREKNEKGDIIFEIKNIGKGCRDGDSCVHVNYTKSKGCYSVQCQEDSDTGDTAFEVTRAGCSDGHGGCIPDGKTFQQGCVTLKCDKSKSKCGLSVVKGGCGFNGKCYDVGGNMTYKCSVYTCEQYKKTYKTLSWKFTPIKRRCSDSHGNCYEVGTKVNTTCGPYECVTGTKTYFAKTWTGYRCLYKDKCYNVGDVFNNTERCCTYRCNEQGKREVISNGCNFKKKCYPANEEFQIGCSTYFCMANATYVAVQHKKLACKVEDQCIPAGHLFKYKCHTFKCSEDKSSCKSELVEYGCKDQQTGACLKTGDIINHKCANYVCAPNGTANPYKFQSQDCSHDGKCFKIGESIKSGACESWVCGQQEDKLVKYPKKGCLRDGVCLEYGYSEWNTENSAYYCKKYQCLNGNMVYNDNACKTADGHCIYVKNGEKKGYHILYNGKRGTASCSRTDGRIKISDIKCPK